MSLKYDYIGLISLFLILIGCFDDVTLSPPCFKEGSSRNGSAYEVEINICCDQQMDGDSFCADYFSTQGYQASSPLSYCTEQSTCRLCELGVNCMCLNSRDCGVGEICQTIDDVSVCEDKLAMSGDFKGRRCAICVASDQ